MSESIEQSTSPAVIPSENTVVQKDGGNIAVTALVPSDMQACHSALIVWCERKIAELQSDADELRGAYEHALEKKWKSATFKNHAAKAEKRVVFYQKMLAALQQGFVIVPNFPIQMFLIRTDREAPLGVVAESRYQQDIKQSAQLLALGEGGYENPFPVVEKFVIGAPAASNPEAKSFRHYAKEWDEVEFPVSMAKPEIMEAVTRAMALNIFDQIGILPKARKEDPLIIGQIIDPRGLPYRDKVVSFMIAWHLDTRIL